MYHGLNRCSVDFKYCIFQEVGAIKCPQKAEFLPNFHLLLGIILGLVFALGSYVRCGMYSWVVLAAQSAFKICA